MKKGGLRMSKFKGHMINLQPNINFTWINRHIDYSGIDISAFLNEDGNIDLDIMIEQIKQELMSCHEKSTEWQANAIMYSYKTD
jgi:hypothetical protein